MILDLNMWKNQIFYIPAEYGQYTGPDHKVFSIPGIFGESSEYFINNLRNFILAY